MADLEPMGEVEVLARALARDDSNEELVFGLEHVSESAKHAATVYREKAQLAIDTLAALSGGREQPEQHRPGCDVLKEPGSTPLSAKCSCGRDASSREQPAGLREAAQAVVEARTAIVQAVTPDHPNFLGVSDEDRLEYTARFTRWHMATVALSESLASPDQESERA